MWDTFFEQASQLRAAGEPFVFATVVACQRPTAAYPGARALIRADGTLTGWVGGSCAQPTVIQEALKALADGQTRLLRISPERQHSAVPQEGVYDFVMTCASQGALEIFVEPFLPRPELVVIGETPVAQALARFAALVDFTVCVSDPDATRERFPDADTLCVDLEAVRARLSPRSYVVIATQGAYDEEALATLIEAPAGYIGLVASGTRAATIFQYLRDKGVQPELLQRVKCPAGLQLGAVTPPEIGFSIMGEILQLRRSNQATDGAHTTVPAADAMPDAAAVDPVCGMTVQVSGARYTSAHDGKTFLFCGIGCKERFDREPARYSVPSPSGRGLG
ncbi:MAG TPA: XdhC family protein [Candidatus Tectomicrobia bacterium]